MVNSNGKPVVPLDPITNKPVIDKESDQPYVKDQNGNDVLPVAPDGSTVIPKDPKTGDIIMPKDSNGKPLLKTDKDGNIVASVDQNGDIIVPTDKDNSPVMNVDHNGDLIPPTDDDGKVIPIVDKDGKPLNYKNLAPEDYQKMMDSVAKKVANMLAKGNKPDMFDNAGVKKDDDDQPILALDDLGNPVIPVDPKTNKPLIPVDSSGNPKPIMNALGKLLVPKKPDGTPILPYDKTG